MVETFHLSWSAVKTTRLPKLTRCRAVLVLSLAFVHPKAIVNGLVVRKERTLHGAGVANFFVAVWSGTRSGTGGIFRVDQAAVFELLSPLMRLFPTAVLYYVGVCSLASKLFSSSVASSVLKEGCCAECNEAHLWSLIVTLVSLIF
jgi:hypothetical protein